MIQHQNKNTFLRKLHPATKLYLCIGLTLSIILFANTFYSAAVFVLGLALVIKEKFYLEFKIIIFTLTLMFISMFLINGTLNPINDFTRAPLFTIPIVNISFYTEGITRSIEVYRRIAPLMCTLFLLFRSMNMTDLGVAMNQMGLPYRGAFIFINVFQIVPILSKEMSQITDAQRSRGLKTDGNIFSRAKALVPIVIPVISNSIMKVQNQAIALFTKGFNSDSPKTIYRDLTKSKADLLLTIISVLLGASSIIYSIAILILK